MKVTNFSIATLQKNVLLIFIQQIHFCLMGKAESTFFSHSQKKKKKIKAEDRYFIL